MLFPDALGSELFACDIQYLAKAIDNHTSTHYYIFAY